MADIPASTWSQTDGSNTSASPDGAPEGMAPSGVNDTMRMIMGAVKRWYAWLTPATTGGTTTAYTVSYSVAPAALVDGMTHVVLFNATCGANPTLNINSLGAKPLYRYSGGSWGAVASGEITANMVCVVSYNSGEGSYRVLGSASTGIGAAFLTVANAFTGNNTFAGTSTFNGAVTANSTASFTGATTVSGNLTATAGTNSIVAALGSSTATTQSASDNSTKVATTAYVDRQATAANLVKAWCIFDGTAGSPLVTAGYNVTSITKNGTGDYTITLTNALTDANYAVGGSVNSTIAATAAVVVNTNTTPTTTAVRIVTTANNAAADFSRVSVTISR